MFEQIVIPLVLLIGSAVGIARGFSQTTNLIDAAKDNRNGISPPLTHADRVRFVAMRNSSPSGSLRRKMRPSRFFFPAS